MPQVFPGFPDYGTGGPPWPPRQWWEHAPNPTFPEYDWTFHTIYPVSPAEGANLQVVTQLVDNVAKLCSIEANLGQELGAEIQANIKRLNDWLTRALVAIESDKKST